MAISPRELPWLAWHGWEVLRGEGPRALWLRAQRRLVGAQGQVFREYARWLELEARGALAPAPAGVGPPLSVVTPVCDPPPQALRELLGSLRAQTHPWELCLADDASDSAAVRRLLDEAALDPRVRLVRSTSRRGIAAATNAALELASSPAVAFLDHDDLLAPEALARVSAALAHPEVDLVYSDEDKLDPRGRRSAPCLKPAFDPLLLLGANYLGHLLVVRRALLEELGRLRPGFDGSQDYDLVLRASERARLVGHVPRVLYHWRASPGSVARSPGAKPWAHEPARRALSEALARRGEPGRVEPGRWLGTYRVVREPPVPLAALSLVLAADRPPPWLAAELPALGLREVLCLGGAGTGAARAAEARQAAAERATGSHLLYLGRVRPTGGARRALEALLSQLGRPGVGFVGGQVLDPAGRVREQGLALGHGPDGLAALPEPGLLPDAPGYFGLASLPRSAAALGDQVLLVARATVLALGWRLDGQAGAVELCWRGAADGLRAVVTPEASFSAEADAAPDASDGAAALRAALGGEVPLDPYWSPGFQRGRAGLGLTAEPPAPPWAPPYRLARARDGAWRLG